MSTVVQPRREAASYVSTHAGAVGEMVVDTTNQRVTVHDGSTLGGFPQASIRDIVGRNRIINGNFAINQRGYASGGTLGASAYAHDRWRDGGDGTLTYTFSQGVCDTLINITAGQITHLIEGSNIEGGFYTLSWAGTCVLYVYYTPPSGSLVGPISAATLQTTNIPAGSLVQIVNVNSSGVRQFGTLGLVQFEAGTIATKFERRLRGQELALCQRYYEVGNYSILGNAYAASSYLGIDVFFKVSKRASPSVTIVNTSYLNASSATNDTINIDSMRIYVVSTGAATNVQGVGTWAALAEL